MTSEETAVGQPLDGRVRWRETAVQHIGNPGNGIMQKQSPQNIKKLRTLARGAVPSPGAPTPASSVSAPDDSAPLPEGVQEAIEVAWIKRHGFHLSGARLLIGSDDNRVYSCLNKKNHGTSEDESRNV